MTGPASKQAHKKIWNNSGISLSIFIVTSCARDVDLARQNQTGNFIIAQCGLYTRYLADVTRSRAAMSLLFYGECRIPVVAATEEETWRILTGLLRGKKMGVRIALPGMCAWAG